MKTYCCLYGVYKSLDGEMARLWQVSHIQIVFREKGTAAWTRGAEGLVEWKELKKSMVEVVPDSLQGLKVCGKLCTAILLLLQLPPECTQLLLSLDLDVIGHHHCCLEVRLEPTPLFFFILKTQSHCILYRSMQVWTHTGKYIQTEIRFGDCLWTLWI